MKVLVTGLSGFVGQNLTRYFSTKKDLELVGLDIINIEDFESYLWNEIDSLPEDINVIIHLAGKAHDLKNTPNEQEYIDVNYGLTKKIYDVFLKSKASKFILMSSVKAVADEVDGMLREDNLAAPKTPYGRSKLMAEEYILSNKAEGKSSYILRPCMIHGPGNKGNLSLLYQLISKQIPWPLGAFENQRSFLSIENLCFVIDEIINNKIENGVYNLADDESISTNELIQIISEGLGKKSSIWKVPKSLIYLLAKLGTTFHLPLNEERLQKLSESYVVSNEKIKKVIGKKLPIHAREGLLQTIKSFA